MTYYLKYRPQTISALDLASVRRELGGVLSSGRFTHAYLFAGPRGTGKTSAARIIAKLVNCERNRKLSTTRKKTTRLLEPCNKCNLCRAITNGTALDLFEIDAASNRGIDDIRELRERIKLAPTEASYKVYIIDEVHMLTPEAFNALLKTLEEPPAHALFVLCTTVPEKLPETVVSRCTRINFHKASEDEVVSSLRKVVKGEKLKIEKGVLKAIAKVVDGSFRDGMKLLEQLSFRLPLRQAGLSKKKGRKKIISLADAREVANLSAKGAARRLLVLLAEGDIKGALSLIDELSKRQSSQEQYVREVLEVLRGLLLTEVGVIEEEKIEGFDLSDIRRLIVLFSEAGSRLRTTMIPELPLELAVIGWFEKSERERISNKSISTKKPMTEEQGSSKSKKQSGSKISFSQIQKNWPKVLQTLRPQNHSLEALLKAAEPKELDGELLVLEVAYPFHKEQLELARYKLMVESTIDKVLSCRLKLRYVLRRQKKQANPIAKSEHENISGAVEDEGLIRVAEKVFGTKSE